MARSLVGDVVENMIAPGDVLMIRGANSGFQVGVAGGAAGHVLVALSHPRRALRDSPEHRHLEQAWPNDGVRELWLVATLESTRGAQGLTQAEVVLWAEPETSRLVIVAERTQKDDRVRLIQHEDVELWQSPQPLRANLRPDFMAAVVRDMLEENDGTWSWSTAARSVLLSADVGRAGGHEETMEEIEACWSQPPICTSIVITFWQRYLCYFARVAPGRPAQPLELILRWMPLKADRALPGQLLAALSRANWVPMLRIPQIFHPVGNRQEDLDVDKFLIVGSGPGGTSMARSRTRALSPAAAVARTPTPLHERNFTSVCAAIPDLKLPPRLGIKDPAPTTPLQAKPGTRLAAWVTGEGPSAHGGVSPPRAQPSLPARQEATARTSIPRTSNFNQSAQLAASFNRSSSFNQTGCAGQPPRSPAAPAGSPASRMPTLLRRMRTATAASAKLGIGRNKTVPEVQRMSSACEKKLRTLSEAARESCTPSKAFL